MSGSFFRQRVDWHFLINTKRKLGFPIEAVMFRFIPAFLASAFSLTSYGSEIIPNLNEFELRYSECATDNFKNECLRNIFAGHFDPRLQGGAELLRNTERFYANWLNGYSVYKIHFARTDEFSNLFETRNYLIERSDGALAGLVIGFRRIKGDWYVYDIQGGVTDEFIRNMLNMQRISVKN